MKNTIQKPEQFVNLPSHTNYQSEIDGMRNLYSPLSHIPQRGKFPRIAHFLKHIFQNSYDKGLDYFQLLYQHPEEKLPILCLVSEMNGTGKTTFMRLLKLIFGENVVMIGNPEITSEFTAIYAGKLIVAIEETLIDKSNMVEKIKMLVSVDKVIINAKNVQQAEVDNFSKVVISSNNTELAQRAFLPNPNFWVINIAQFEGDRDPFLLQTMEKEIPAFLHFLNTRQLLYPEKKSRLWFPLVDNGEPTTDN